MDQFTAIMIAEGSQAPIDDEQYFEAWQYLVDTGLCWSLQGFFGRTAKAMIEAGVISAKE